MKNSIKDVIVFPGQGFQSMKMLNTYVQQFCLEHGLYEILNDVLKDNKKLFQTKYAQPLIVATQLAEYERYKKVNGKDKEPIFVGFSLGEITALIASNTISVEEGLKFVIKRGEESKRISEEKHQLRPGEEAKQLTYGVTKLDYTEELKRKLDEWNSTHSEFEQINITNYRPMAETTPVDGQIIEDVTITGEYETLSSNIEFFGGELGQEMPKMQCPFHTTALSKLMPVQEKVFDETITDINFDNIDKVFSTRTGEFYRKDITKEELSKALAQYLIEPIQQTKTLKYIKDNYGTSDILSTIGGEFMDSLKDQYTAVGGNSEQMRHIGDGLDLSQNFVETSRNME